jgi:hypothetical protein
MDQTVKERLAAIAWAGWRVDTAALVPNPELYEAAPDVEVRDRALIDYHWHPDGAGWQHKVYAWLQGNNTGITHEIVNAAGQLVQTLQTPMPRVGGVAMKIDRLNISQSGAKMVYAVAAHEVSSLPTRLVWGGTLVVENVCHPYPQGQQEQGRDVPTALIGEPGGGEPQTEVDYPRIEQIVTARVDAAVNRLIVQFGGGSVRGGIQEKVEDALVRVFDREYQGSDPRPADFQAKFSATLYQSAGLFARLSETLYMVARDNKIVEAAHKVLGLPWPPPQP